MVSENPILEMTTMEGRGKFLINMLEMLGELKAGPLYAVETGCVRSLDLAYVTGDGYSTLYLARWAKNHGTKIVSIDNDAGHVEVAKRVLCQEGLESCVTFIVGSAADVLSMREEPIDLAYLDTAVDVVPTEILDEFNAVRKNVRSPALVAIDDSVGMYPCEDNKGALPLKLAKELDLQTGSCGRMLVIAFGEAASLLPRIQNLKL